MHTQAPNDEILGLDQDTRFSQDANVAQPAFAIELLDPGFQACPPGYGVIAGSRCRFSDTAMGEVQPTWVSDVAKGTIWKPTASAPAGAGVSVSTGSGNFLTVVNEFRNPPEGYTVHKIGRTTGWSYGPIHRADYHLQVYTSDTALGQKYLLSQNIVDSPGVGAGDSGSVVFVPYYADPANQAAWGGIVWAEVEISSVAVERSVAPATRRPAFIFSDFDDVQADLGSFYISP